MDSQELQAQRQFHIHQKVTFAVNRYRVFADDDGKPGLLVAFVEQKRMTFKEEVTLYIDEDRSAVLARFKARKVIDVGGGYDVTAAEGPIGVFRKRFGKSLLRSTWELEQPGQEPVVVQERSKINAILRRLFQVIPVVNDFPTPWRYHFDFLRDTTSVGAFEKTTRLRDHYLLRIDDQNLDRRLLLAQAVALDALQSR